MSLKIENTFRELNDLFEELRKTHHGNKNQESGDNFQNIRATQNNVDNIIKHIDEILNKSSKDNKHFKKLTAMKSSLLYEKAKLLLGQADNVSCQENLELALEIILDFYQDPQIYYLYLRLMNHLAYVLSKKGDLVKSKTILETITQKVAPSHIIVYRYYSCLEQIDDF